MDIAVKSVLVLLLLASIGMTTADMHRPKTERRIDHRMEHRPPEPWERGLGVAIVLALATGCVIWWPVTGTWTAVAKWVTVASLVVTALVGAVRRQGTRPGSVRVGLWSILADGAVIVLALYGWA